jgi:hypothetical protein
MAKKKQEPEVEVVEPESVEEALSRDDLDIEVAVGNDDPVVYVKFSGFLDEEDAEEYAEFLAETLPLLLFESTRLQ